MDVVHIMKQPKLDEEAIKATKNMKKDLVEFSHEGMFFLTIICMLIYAL
jgi:hypothetical protein